MISLCSIETFSKIANSNSFNFLCESTDERPGMMLQPALAPSSYLEEYVREHPDPTSEQRLYIMNVCRQEFKNCDFEAAMTVIIALNNTGAQINLIGFAPVKCSHLLVIGEELRARGQSFNIV